MKNPFSINYFGRKTKFEKRIGICMGLKSDDNKHQLMNDVLMDSGG